MVRIELKIFIFTADGQTLVTFPAGPLFEMFLLSIMVEYSYGNTY